MIAAAPDDAIALVCGDAGLHPGQSWRGPPVPPAKQGTLPALPRNYTELTGSALTRTACVIPSVMAALPDLTGMTVLDLGCGGGPPSLPLLLRGAARVYGVDI